MNWGTKMRNYFYFSTDREHKAARQLKLSCDLPGKQSGNPGNWDSPPTQMRSGWRLLVPNVSREKLPLPGKTAAPQQEAGITTAHEILRVKSFLDLHLLNLCKTPQEQRKTSLPCWRNGTGESPAAQEDSWYTSARLLGFFKRMGMICFFGLVWWLFGAFWLILFS